MEKPFYNILFVFIVECGDCVHTCFTHKHFCTCIYSINPYTRTVCHIQPREIHTGIAGVTTVLLRYLVLGQSGYFSIINSLVLVNYMHWAWHHCICLKENKKTHN